jgi:hypothetical protein
VRRAAQQHDVQTSTRMTTLSVLIWPSLLTTVSVML